MHMLLLLLLGSDVFALGDPLAQKATILGVQQKWMKKNEDIASSILIMDYV